MANKLTNIIKDIFVDKKINKLQKTEKDIIKTLGKTFFKKHIEKMFLQKNKIIIQTTNIEAKTELNIVKKNFNTTIILL
tara:strand:- start:118 stop:354 length:237 start_codon:yes stop_codon:yes gene_type:complete